MSKVVCTAARGDPEDPPPDVLIRWNVAHRRAASRATPPGLEDLGARRDARDDSDSCESIRVGVHGIEKEACSLGLEDTIV